MSHTLAVLADEVLTKILDDASLYVVSLWLAGNINFNKRIVRCCKKIRSDPSMQLYTIKVWPRMFAELKSLEVVALDVYRIYERIDVLKAQVQLLSPTVTELNLRFKLASVILLDNFHFNSAINVAPALSLPTQVLKDRTINGSTWDLKAYLPALKKAALVEKKDKDFQIEWSFHSHSFCIFPETLTHLEWNVGSGRIEALEHLPKSLTSLEFGYFNTETFYRPFPLPRISHLRGITLRGKTFPSTLRTGNWTSHSFLHNNLTSTEAALLPPTLLSLEGRPRISLLDDRWGIPLPPNLTILAVNVSSPLHACHIAALPPTLTTLAHANLNLDDIYEKTQELGAGTAGFQLWPSKLSELTITLVTPIKMHQLSVFPPTLTILGPIQVESLQTVLEQFSSVLPPKLTSFTAYAPDMSTNKEYFLPEHFANLPLRSLSLHGVGLNLANLPRGLTALALPNTTILRTQRGEASWPSLLPPTLEALEICSFTGPASEFDRLPPSLTELRMSTSQPRLVTTLQQLKSLPSSLLTLQLQANRTLVQTDENRIFRHSKYKPLPQQY